MTRVFWSALSIATVAYLGLGLILYVTQENYVFFPSRPIAHTPANIGLNYDKVRLTAADGVVLRGWFVPAPDAEFTLLFMHGNAGNISHRLDSLRVFHDLGVSIFIFDYRGYGQSEGSPSEEGTYQDAEAAWRYLVEQRGIPAHRIVLLGRSLGGAVAAWLAMQHPPRGLILESTFTSVEDMGRELYPFLPIDLISRIHYNTLRRIGAIRRPVLVVHSRDDEIVPFSHGRRVFAAANQPKAFLEIRGDHNSGFLATGEDYLHGIRGFLQALKLEHDPAAKLAPAEAEPNPEPESEAAPPGP